jgi:hypothetical protein
VAARVWRVAWKKVRVMAEIMRGVVGEEGKRRRLSSRPQHGKRSME